MDDAAAARLTDCLRLAWDNRSLPLSVMEDGNMKLLWDYTNIIIST